MQGATTRRKDAPRLPRPVGRYWKGRVPKGVNELADDLDSDIEEEKPVETEDVLLQDDLEVNVDDSQPKGSAYPKAINITLKDVNISEEGKVIVHGKEESGRTASERAAIIAQEISSDEEKEEEEETESSNESGSTDSEPAKPVVAFRPVFVPKRARMTVPQKDSEQDQEIRRQREQEAEIRRKQSHDMVAESIKRELAEKETEEHVPDVDDTDGLDLTAEFEAWRLRELNRIKRDKEQELRREEEKAEIERRRALPEEVRLKEDLERAQKSREEKPKGKQKFLQKYWHKGAFHQDSDVMVRRDYTQATESTVDVTLLPKIMQVRDFGKRSRTKYTHLLDQDTTVGRDGGLGVGQMRSKSSVGQGCFLCGGPHLKKDCPQLNSMGEKLTGANRTAFGSAALNETRENVNIRGRDDGQERLEQRQKSRESTSPLRTRSVVPTSRRRRSNSHSRERDYSKKQKMN